MIEIRNARDHHIAGTGVCREPFTDAAHVAAGIVMCRDRRRHIEAKINLRRVDLRDMPGLKVLGGAEARQRQCRGNEKRYRPRGIEPAEHRQIAATDNTMSRDRGRTCNASRSIGGVIPTASVMTSTRESSTAIGPSCGEGAKITR